MNNLKPNNPFEVNFIKEKISFVGLFRFKFFLFVTIIIVIFFSIPSFLILGRIYYLQHEIVSLHERETQAEIALAGMYKNDVVAILDDKQKIELQGFNQILYGLSTLHFEQLWLNQVDIKDFPRMVTISGQALDSSLVQLYYSKLLQLPAFSAMNLRITALDDTRTSIGQKEKQALERQRNQGVKTDDLQLGPVTNFVFSNLKEKEMKKNQVTADTNESQSNGF